MFPYRDENETQRPAIVTLAIIAVNVLVWLLIQGAGSEASVAASICNLGLIPGELTGALAPGTTVPLGEGLACVAEPGRGLVHLFTHMFLHGSWMHLLGNMWFLWLFGNNIEDSMGHSRFLMFYILCGLAAAFAQIATGPDAAVPMVGASGAISGVMGGYLLLYPTVRVYTLVVLGFFITSLALPAWAMLGYWFAIQFFSGLVSFGGQMGGVAFWAHVGGFVAGIALIKLFARGDYIDEHQAQRWRPRSVIGGY
ncbi:MAG TPA: rhomboid family intramembrane serine protease [Candidatus Binatia bacterium]|jgi:membrane associated rhomboid family serine protease